MRNRFLAIFAIIPLLFAGMFAPSLAGEVCPTPEPAKYNLSIPADIYDANTATKQTLINQFKFNDDATRKQFVLVLYNFAKVLGTAPWAIDEVRLYAANDPKADPKSAFLVVWLNKGCVLNGIPLTGEQQAIFFGQAI